MKRLLRFAPTFSFRRPILLHENPRGFASQPVYQMYMYTRILNVGSERAQKPSAERMETGSTADESSEVSRMVLDAINILRLENSCD